MRSRFRGSRLVALLALFGLLIAACGGDDDDTAGGGDTGDDTTVEPSGDAPDGDPIVLGVVLPLTGVAGSIGTSTLVGIEAEVDRVNAEGGILGRPIKIEVRDDGTDAQRGALAGRELMENPDLVALVPSAISSTALAILPEATEKKILTVTAAVAPAVSDPTQFPYSFSVTFSSLQNEAAAVARMDDLGIEKVGLVASDDETGRGFIDHVEGYAEDAGLEVVGSETFPIDGKDVTANLQKLRDAGAEGLLVYPPGSSIGVLMTGMADLGWDVPVVGAAAAITGDVEELVPDASADQLEAITTRLAARFDDERSAVTEERLEAIIAKGDVTSMTNAATGVDMVAAMKYAFETAGSFDGEAATKALEGLATADVPADTFFMFASSSPGYDADTHRPDNADTDQGFWAVVRVSELINGTLEGEPFDIG